MKDNKTKQDNGPEKVNDLGEVQNDPTMDLAEETAETTEVNDVVDDDSEEDEVAAMFNKLQETEQQLEKKSKDYLFLMADFDNYRKRVQAEKADLIKNAAEKVLRELLPIVDDFERALDATKNDSDGQQVREGMELIYKKLVKYLESNGVKAIDSTGQPFDADLHDAIAVLDVADPEQKGKVLDTTTKGYTLHDKVLRHAKVAVGK